MQTHPRHQSITKRTVGRARAKPGLGALLASVSDSLVCEVDVRCDETKPACLRCIKAQRTCHGYPENSDGGTISHRQIYFTPNVTAG